MVKVAEFRPAKIVGPDPVAYKREAESLVKCDGCPYAFDSKGEPVCTSYKKEGTCTQPAVIKDFISQLPEIEAVREIVNLGIMDLIRKFNSGYPVMDDVERLSKILMDLHKIAHGELKIVSKKVDFRQASFSLKDVQPAEIAEEEIKDAMDLDLSPSMDDHALLPPAEMDGEKMKKEKKEEE